MYGINGEERHYLFTIRQTVENLPDVTTKTIHESFDWKSRIEMTSAKSCAQIVQLRDKLQVEKNRQFTLAYEDKDTRIEEKNAARSEYFRLDNEIERLNKLIDLPCTLEITSRERQLLKDDVLLVYGDPGIGKSQLVAHKTQQLINANRDVLLLVAGIYFTDDPIQDQIMKNLRLDYSFEALIDILEAIGEKDECVIPVFIDALNETWNSRLWKSGLPAIISKIKQSAMVKLIVTYRTEYKKQLIPDSILQMTENGEVLQLLHRGFEYNNQDAVRYFLNHYNIPYTPLECFGYEMINPLFLTLYCKTYNGEEVSFPELYDRLIKQANKNIFKSMGKTLINKRCSETDEILEPLVSEIAKIMVTKKKKYLTQTEINNLAYWSHFDLAPIPFINLLEKEQILHDSYDIAGNEEKYFYFSYDQMNDYFCAKEIFKIYKSKLEIRQYLSDNVLKIENKSVKNHGNIGLFVNVCAMYAEQFGEECIDIIDEISNEYDKQFILERYIQSFQWRRANSTTAESFKSILKKYQCCPDDVWETLIGNSVKTTCPLNADFLHELLFGYQLNQRDYVWTTCINDVGHGYGNRIIELIELYNRGEKLDFSSEKQVELLLTLFSWLLTSSNRWLRDNASKAMIEILKEHFQISYKLLQKFEGVNDPYVFQRLYGIVFGACCKRKNTDYDIFKQLAEYVYNSIFNKERVYPDILLRDYARLIIERFLYENASYTGNINSQKIVPPYNSEPIPKIEDQHYDAREYSGALGQIIYSMQFNINGAYGDFGRYVFQSALDNFEVDEKEIMNYAIYFIVNELEFSEDYFGEYDRYTKGYDRNLTIKTERIGKKYQWIAMYNILARVSDHCKMIDRYNMQETDSIQFEGAWDPYVRDFDPTLNQNFMVCDSAPKFQLIEDLIKAAGSENDSVDISSEDQQQLWLNSVGILYRRLKEMLLMKDDNGTEWVSLSAYYDTGTKDLDIKRLLVWSSLHAYFVSPTQKKDFEDCVNKNLSIISYEVIDTHKTYTVFNREYPWAPSCVAFNDNAWANVSLKTGKKETIHKIIQKSDPFLIEDYLQILDNIDEQEEAFNMEKEGRKITGTEFHLPDISGKEITYEIEEEKEIGKILHASTNLLWEEEYDASKKDPISWSVPCAEVIEKLHLRLRGPDGFYFDCDGKLAAYDVKLTQNRNCVVIRKDLLDKFLDLNGMKLIWIMEGEKEIHGANWSTLAYSKWESLFTYEKDHISGNIHRIP